MHQELWIPSEALETFNKNIINNIIIVEAYYGDKYKGSASINTVLSQKQYIEQFVCLKELKENNLMDYTCEVLSQWKVITQNYFLWKQTNFIDYNIDEKERDSLLLSIKKALKDNVKWFIGDNN